MTIVTVMNHETDEDGITHAYPMELELDDEAVDDTLIGYCNYCGQAIHHDDGTDYYTEPAGIGQVNFYHEDGTCPEGDYEPDYPDTETSFGGYATGWGDDTPMAYDDYYDGGD